MKVGDFSGLTGLETLYLEDNRISNVPNSIFGELTNLRLLTLHYNRLTSLPEELFDGLTKLKYLYLDHNSLASLPEDLFDGVTSLYQLWFSGNSLTSLPEDLFDGLTNLSSLKFGYNSLTSLPEDLFDGLTSLSDLGFSSNSLTSLHEDLFDGLTNLEWLYFANNSLTSLHEDLFDGLTSLKTLNLSSNSLTSLHEDLFDGLTSLKTLNLSDNGLRSLPDNLFDHVTLPQELVVHLGGNSINCLPAAIVNNPAVTTVPAYQACGATATLSLSPASISENGGISVVTATLDQPSSAVTTVAVSAVPQAPALASDYNLSTNTTLTIAAGQTTSTGTVTITANDNAVDAPDKTVTVQGVVTNAQGIADPADAILTITDDDVALTATLVISPASISENGGITTVTAMLDTPPSTEVKISVSTMPEAAVSPDFALSPNDTLRIAAGTTTSTGAVTINAVDNDVDAPHKTVTIRGTVVTSTESVIGPADVMLTITDDDNAPTVTLVLSSLSIGENEGSTTVEAMLDRPSSEATTVTVMAVPQLPATSADYNLSTNTTLMIAAGQTTSTGMVTIMAVDNDVDAPNKTITIQGSASNPQGVAGPADVTLTITEDDVAGVTAPTSVAVTEGGSKNLRVVLSSQPMAGVTVTVTGHAGTDLTVSPTALTFTPTTWNAPQTVTLRAAEDGDTTNDPIPLMLTASGGGYSVTHSVAVKIIDNDTASLTAPASVTVPEGDSRDLSVALSSPPTAEVTVMVTGHAGTDLTPTPSALIFTTANWSIPQDVTLRAMEDDDLTDDPVTLTLRATGGGYVNATHRVAVTITDNDAPAVAAPVSVVVPEGDTGTLPVTLSAQPSAEVMVTVTGYAGTDLRPDPVVLTFLPTNWHALQTVTLAAAEDGDFTNDQVTLTLTASGRGYAGVTHSVAVLIIDNDVAAMTAPPSVMIPEGRSTHLPVALAAPPSAEVTLTITGYAGTDLIPTPPVLIFTPTDWSTPQTVTLTAAEDGDFTDDQVMLTLAATGGGYTGITHSVAVTITDNDVAAVTAPTSVAIPEGSTADLSVALLSPPTAAVTLTIAGYAGTDLRSTPVTLTFTTTDWATSQTVTLRASEDDDFVDDRVVLTLTGSGGGYMGVTHAVTVAITDNDLPTVTAPPSVVIAEGGTSDLSVALSAQPTAAVTVTTTGHAGTDLTSAPEILTFTRANWNVTQAIVLTAAEDEDFTDDSVTLTLAASGGGYAGVTHSVAVTITDNDTEAPLSVSIYDLEVLENATMGQLRVELSRASDQVVTVQYATSDKTAEKGSDYTASRGIVVFDRHTTKGVIPVAILDDAIAEADEQLMVTLSKPRNAVIERGVGTLTIVDNDGDVTLRIEDEVVEADAGVIRFTVQLSRPSSESVTVAYRTEDGTAKAGEDYRASSGVVEFAPGAVAATIAVPLLLKNLDWQQFSVHLERSTHARIAKAVAVATIRKADSVTRDMLAAFTARFVRTLSVQVVEALQERVRTHTDGSACGAGARAELARLWHAPSDWTPSLGELLAGCHISEGMMGGAVRVWGRGAFRQFHGQENLRGEVATGLAGVDYDWNGRWVTGLLLAHSRGEGTYAVHTDSGELQSRLTGLYPYVAYQSQERGIWGTGGYGRGRAEALELEGGLGSGFGALGFWGRLGSTHPVQLTYYGDGIYADAVVRRQDVDTQVYRLRLGLEADVQIREGIRPYVKASVRQDGGSAETGLGLELGGGVRVAVPAWRLRADVQTQGLVVHTAEGFTEWGVSGSVQVGEQAQGLMLRVRPSWGPEMSLSHQQTVLDVVPAGRSLHRTEMELGYGVAMGQGTARSILGATWQSGGALLRLGGELRPRDRFTLSAFGLVHAHAAAWGNIGLNLRGSLRY